jgi:hypothetical protein
MTHIHLTLLTHRATVLSSSCPQLMDMVSRLTLSYFLKWLMITALLAAVVAATVFFVAVGADFQTRGHYQFAWNEFYDAVGGGIVLSIAMTWYFLFFPGTGRAAAMKVLAPWLPYGLLIAYWAFLNLQGESSESRLAGPAIGAYLGFFVLCLYTLGCALLAAHRQRWRNKPFIVALLLFAIAAVLYLFQDDLIH